MSTGSVLRPRSQVAVHAAGAAGEKVKRKRVAILGATGSIGGNAIDVSRFVNALEPRARGRLPRWPGTFGREPRRL